MRSKPILTKETFCEALRLIKEQEEKNDKFSRALNEMGNGFIAFGGEDRYLDAVLIVLKEAMDDKYDYIRWWLYEASGNYKVSIPYTNKQYKLETPEALYDYIANECD